MKTFSFFLTRRFFPLFGTQFLGAFNDNLLKTALIVLISYHGLTLAGISSAQLVNISSALFILPFFLFSASAGHLSEAFDKAQLARWIKLCEIAIMLIAAVGFYLHNTAILLIALFLMGTHSSFFGPLKYSVLPQYLQAKELIGGNGLIEMGTFLAILFGQIGGSLLAPLNANILNGILLLVALFGFCFSRYMPSAKPSLSPTTPIRWRPLHDTKVLLKDIRQYREAYSAILGISWFWLMGAVYTTQLPVFTKLHLGGNETVYTVFLALFSVGIGLGSMVCAKLSKGEIELGLVLLGSVGMSLTGAGLALSAWNWYPSSHLMDLPSFLSHAYSWLSILLVFALGFFGGFFTVPLYTYLQTSSPDAFRSQAIAANNIINGFYMVTAAIFCGLVLLAFNHISVLFLITALANVLATYHLIRRIPSMWQDKWRWLKAAP